MSTRASVRVAGRRRTVVSSRASAARDTHRVGRPCVIRPPVGGEIYSSLEGGRNGRYTPTQTGQGPPGPDGAYRDQGRSRAPRPFSPPARLKAGTRGAGAVWAGARASRPFSPHSRPRQDPGGPGRSRRTHGHRARFPRTRTQGRNPGGQGGVGGRHKAKYERALARTKDAQDVSPAGAT